MRTDYSTIQFAKLHLFRYCKWAAGIGKPPVRFTIFLDILYPGIKDSMHNGNITKDCAR